MRGSKKKNLMLSTSTSHSNCFSSILKSFTCGGNLPSPAPSDHHHHHHILPIFKSNGYIHPNPNEFPKSEPTSTSTSSHFVDQDGNFEVAFGKDDDDDPRQPGLVARLMGLESMPNHPDLEVSRDSIMNLRSKSLNSLHLYIYPDTFLDHVSPSPSFSHHQRRKPCHRRSLTSSPSLCVKQSTLQEKVEPLASNVGGNVVTKPEKRRVNGEFARRKKVDGENERSASKKIGEKGLVIGRRKEIDESKNGRKKGFDNKAVASKCRVNVDQRTRKRLNKRDDPRKEIKYTVFVTKLNKEKRSVDEFKHNHRHGSKDGSTRRRRRRSSTKTTTNQQDVKTNEGMFRHRIEEQNPKEKEMCSVRREEIEDHKELMMSQVIRLAEECVRDDEWINFDENVKELGVDFGREMLQVLINQLIDELFGYETNN